MSFSFFCLVLNRLSCSGVHLCIIIDPCLDVLLSTLTFSVCVRIAALVVH